MADSVVGAISLPAKRGQNAKATITAEYATRDTKRSSTETGATSVLGYQYRLQREQQQTIPTSQRMERRC